MRVVIQRVSQAEVRVDGRSVGAIGPDCAGLLVFLGVGQNDGVAEAEWLVERLLKLRIFDDGEGKMNRSLLEVEGEALVVSQFTLFGNIRKGNRPSYNRAARPEQAVPLYEYFVRLMSERLGRVVPTGEFGADMKIDVRNDGPVTLVLDSEGRDF
ncbi:D-aminoacyl-tRNA deacylase [Coraliomargarita parva]|uniref:D-aminoacyl-tRNA deacylase n=1 Tax=Coraliomargarita parva TaxID=3014050 RepID=UPI0022B38D03|nr:D-aminoacyl-tRNA deacylase [Coraliomargarita parva]